MNKDDYVTLIYILAKQCNDIPLLALIVRLLEKVVDNEE